MNSETCGQPVQRGPQRGRGRRVGLTCVFVGALAAAGGLTKALAAQDRSAYRLTVRPREMAIGTENAHAGEFQLDRPFFNPDRRWAKQSIDSAMGNHEDAPETPWVYVPPRCVGTHRCPLLVFVWDSWNEIMTWVRPMADQYGIILLGPGSGYWNLIYPKEPADTVAIEQRKHLDALLIQVFQRFAIDPDKIAIMGTCATGLQPVSIGVNNPQVFHRIISLSAAAHRFEPVGPPTPTSVEFFFGGGMGEALRYSRITPALRQQGYRVVQAFGIQGHGHSVEIYDHVGRWLAETWAKPDPATRAVPSTLVDPLPRLTTDLLTKMATFWRRFVAEPDSIRTIARREHLRPITVPIGTQHVEGLMTDMAALAARYPSVAADLKAAGLTALTHDRYRVALLNAQLVQGAVWLTKSAWKSTGYEPMIGKLDSVQAQNSAFVDAHPDEWQALESAGNGYARIGLFWPANIWHMP